MRIIAGTLKNRRIKSREGRETRPTLERIKEAIFSIIGEKVVDAKFLDLYSGTGNVSFEALSRGAKRAIMIEEDKEALRVIIENVNHLGVEEKCRAYKNDVFRAIEILVRMAVKKQSYEENITQIDEILEKLESEELSLDDSISEYEKAIKLIKDSEKLLEAGEGKVMKVLEKNGKVEMEEFE